MARSDPLTFRNSTQRCLSLVPATSAARSMCWKLFCRNEYQIRRIELQPLILRKRHRKPAGCHNHQGGNWPLSGLRLAESITDQHGLVGNGMTNLREGKTKEQSA